MTGFSVFSLTLAQRTRIELALFLLDRQVVSSRNLTMHNEVASSVA